MIDCCGGLEPHAEVPVMDRWLMSVMSADGEYQHSYLVYTILIFWIPEKSFRQHTDVSICMLQQIWILVHPQTQVCKDVYFFIFLNWINLNPSLHPSRWAGISVLSLHSHGAWKVTKGLYSPVCCGHHWPLTVRSAWGKSGSSLLSCLVWGPGIFAMP